MSTVQARCFIVGAARSGTTLLQAMLANHPQVFSFPESHFFCHAAPRGRWRRRLGLVRRDLAREALDRTFRLLQLPEGVSPAPAWSPFFRSYSARFVGAVDLAAHHAGKPVWVEKTPHHIDFIPAIARQVGGARFVHILRDGRDVVASQFHAQQQDPEYWRNWSLERMAQQWNADIQTSVSCLGKDRHMLISYEQLVGNPESTLRPVCEFVGLSFDSSMLRHWEATERILGTRKNEPWMQTAFQPLQDRRGRKFRSALDPSQRRRVESTLRFHGDLAFLFNRQIDSEVGPGTETNHLVLGA